MNFKTGLLVWTVFFVSSCAHQEDRVFKNTLFARLSPEETRIHFANNIVENEKFNLFTYRNIYNGGGVGLGDVNNDGLPDIYFTSNQGKNRLYLNQGNFRFKDITDSAGVGGNAFWSAGVSMVDINNDGMLDIYVLNSGDIFGSDRRNELFINQGNLTFTEEAEKYNLDDNAFSVHAVFFDYDGDGDLDCYLLNNSYILQKPKGWKKEKEARGIPDSLGGDKLLRNDPSPDGTGRIFTDVSEQAGIYQGELGFGLGIAVGDVNGDMKPDIYVSNDFWERDYLYINKGDGTFQDKIISAMDHISQSSMGNDIADINNDGWLDIYVTDILADDIHRLKTMTRFDPYQRPEPKYHSQFHYQGVHNTLQVNNGTGSFRETSFLSGVAATDWSWASLIFDFNNDGWKDIYVTNGMLKDITDFDFAEFINDEKNIKKIVRERGTFNVFDFLDRMPSQKIKNSGFVNTGGHIFKNRTDSLGFFEPAFSHGAAYGDLDNDGDLDMVVNNLNEKAFVYQNNTERYFENHYLQVYFEGGVHNLQGIGSRVEIFYDGKQQILENIPARAYQSTVTPYLHFGLGQTERLDSLRVIWPDHAMQTLNNVNTNQILTLKKEDATQKFTQPALDNKQLLTEITHQKLKGDYIHTENFHNDFKSEVMLPHMLSTEGPALAVGDVNGDGKDDFWMAGAKDEVDKIFIQQKDGTLSHQPNPYFEIERSFESTAGVFIDLNSDGNPDLLLGSGGYDMTLQGDAYKLRAYKNNGNGVFTSAHNLAPQLNINTAVLSVNDFDQDGDKDLFVGARAQPRNYGIDPRSYLFRNEGNGEWTDVTPEKMKNAGMITDAVWTDYNQNGYSDLVIVGEWMPVMMFRNKKGRVIFDTQIANSEGWWSAIETVDLHYDGDVDFVLGNWGANSRFNASVNKPMNLYVNDFNADYSDDFVITTFVADGNKAYPFATFKDLVMEFPDIRNRISTHQEFAGKTYKDIFTPQQREGAEHKQVVTLHSSLLVNDNGSFQLQKLPVEAQISPVHKIIVSDFNRDDISDLLLMGNHHGLKPEVGWLGSNHGVLLIGDGDANFTFVSYHQTNIEIKGEIRDASLLQINGLDHLLVGRNNDSLLLYQINSMNE